MPAEPEETEELVMSDFSFTWEAGAHLPDVERLDRDTFFELFPHEVPERLQERFTEKRMGLTAPGGVSSPLLIAETPDGELAGFCWGAIEGTSVHIVQLAVTPALRGLGLGESLLRKFLTGMRGRGMRRLTTELMGKSLRSSDFFRSVGFSTVTQTMECSLQDLPW